LLSHNYQLKVNIRFRLGLAFGLGVLYTFILLLTALYQQRSLHETLQRHDLQLIPAVRAIYTVTDRIGALRRHETQLLMTTDAAEMTDQEAKLAQDRTLLQAALENYRAFTIDSADRASYEQIRSLTLEYLQMQDRVVALSRAGQHDAAIKLHLGDSRKTFYALNDAASAWATRNASLAEETARNGDALYLRNRRVLIGMASFMLLSAVVSAIRLSDSITRPLRSAAELARRVARGDLTQRIEVPGTDELCTLFIAMNDMTSQLAELIADVVHSAQAVETTAGELAQRNDELSERATQQAASLRQTAVSMEQISLLGKSNSDNAADADRLGSQARGFAESGGEVVAQAVDAMGAINQGSTKISSFIAMIDEIAFQTNLLALNAAVEAARAGDQGRGFAVVASEVRALAQRSADAARQIKGLITDSAGSVHKGSELVDRTGLALTQIQTSVRDMSGLIREIAKSSHEQSVGFQRINEAMLHLDQATHQNTELAEQGTEATRTLLSHADALARRASFFTINDPQHTASAA
jgi:methyl-accepting chemotaxis protein